MIRIDMTARYGSLECPITHAALEPASKEKLEKEMGESLSSRSQNPLFADVTEVLATADRRSIYPVVNGFPVLLAPERLLPESAVSDIDLKDQKYREAYEEMAFYNGVASRQAEEIVSHSPYSALCAIFKPIMEATPEQRDSFPNPPEVWLNSVYDCAAQWDIYSHIAPVRGKTLLQIGGTGVNAIKMLLAGAEESWLLTPILGEALCGLAMARRFGVEDRFRCVLGVAEELPFRPESFDVIHTQGCFHHMVVHLAVEGIERALKPNGKFAASEPWRAPLYKIGTTIFGKREEDVHCKPLTMKRLKAFRETFSRTEMIHHGAITRYPLLALMKLGLNSNLSLVWKLNRLDDRICSCIPGARKMGSSISCLAVK